VDGFRHAIEIEADSLYEAAAVAAKTFHDYGCPPAFSSELQIAVKPPTVTHGVTLKRVQDWTATSAKSPRDRVQKDRVKGLLAELPSLKPTLEIPFKEKWLLQQRYVDFFLVIAPKL
jgi:hypothetical protein